MSTKTIKLWASVLKSIPDARLIIKRSPLKIEAARNRILNQFKTEGVPNKRILFSWDIKSTADHLKEYSNIDIALDTFPYNGTTTTCDALWMGVPVLVLKGRKFISKCGESINHNLGMSDWVAENEEDFILKAVDICSDYKKLSDLRANLRYKALNSPLFDTKKFANNFHVALWKMWKIFLNKN